MNWLMGSTIITRTRTTFQRADRLKHDASEFKEWVDEWMGGLQKLITVLCRFDTDKRGV